MARTPDIDNRNKRKKTAQLSKEAFVIYKNIKLNSNLWDFSRWVSEKLIEEFSDTEKKIIINEMQQLSKERDNVNNKIEFKMRNLADRLEKLTNKGEQE